MLDHGADNRSAQQRLRPHRLSRSRLEPMAFALAAIPAPGSRVWAGLPRVGAGRADSYGYCGEESGGVVKEGTIIIDRERERVASVER